MDAMKNWHLASPCLVWLGILASTYPASAQTFQERWSPIPKAHSEPNAQPRPNNSQAQPDDPSRWWSPIPKAHAETKPPSPPKSQAGQDAKLRAIQPRAKHEAKSTRPPSRGGFVGRTSYHSYKGSKTASGRADGFTGRSAM